LSYGIIDNKNKISTLILDMVITSDNNTEYLLVRSAGSLQNESDLFKHARLIYEEFKKHHNKKIMIDALATEFPSDLFAYYELIQFYIEKLPPEIRELRLACVISPAYSNAGKFWQTASNNRGFQYRAFTSVREAEEWLIE
jgi:hypothetical protein